MTQNQRRKNQKAKRDAVTAAARAAAAAAGDRRLENTSELSQTNLEDLDHAFRQPGEEPVPPRQYKARKPSRKAMRDSRHTADHFEVPVWQQQQQPFIVPQFFNPGPPADFYPHGGFPVGNAFPSDVPFGPYAAPVYQPGYLGAPVFVPQFVMDPLPYPYPVWPAVPFVEGMDGAAAQHIIAPGDHLYYQPPGCFPEYHEGTSDEIEPRPQVSSTSGSANLRADAPEFVSEPTTRSLSVQVGCDTRRQSGVLLDRRVKTKQARELGHRLGLGLGMGSRVAGIHLKKRSKSI